MRYKHRGAILGTLFTFLCSTIYSYHNPYSSYCTIAATETYNFDQVQQNEAGLTYGVDIKTSSYPQSYSFSVPVQTTVATMYFNTLAQEVEDDDFCRDRYELSSRDIKYLYKVPYSDIVSKLLSLDHLTNWGMIELWCLYTRYCYKTEKVKLCQQDLKNRLEKRTERLKNQRLEKLKQEELRIENQKKKAAEEEEQNQQTKHYEKVYSYNVLDLSDEDSSYKNERQLALQQTQQEGYKQHEIAYEFDEQAAGLMKSQGIDPQQFQSLSGTLFQHQLFGEVAQYYKKAAKVVYEHQFDNGLFVPFILQFGQCALRATSLEQFGLAIQLNDLSDFMAETSLSICKGAICSACNLVELGQTGCSLLVYCIENPTALSEKFYTLLGRVINTVGNGVSAIASNEDGWAMYAECLERQYQFSKQYAQEVAGKFKTWCKETTVQDKIELGSQVAFDALLFSMAGKACSGIMSQIPEIRFLEGFADISAEYGVATEFGEVGLTSLEKAGMSLMEFEVKAAVEKSEILLDATKNVIRNTKKPVSKCKIFQDISAKDFKEKVEGSDKLVKIIENRRSFTKNGANGVANNVNGKKLLMKKLELVERFEQIADKKKVLPDGRIRYYEPENLATTPGPTRGSGMVVEHDVKRGNVRAWYESRDHQGKVNRVNPKFLNGQEVFSQHYPPIAKDLKFFEVNPKKR